MLRPALLFAAAFAAVAVAVALGGFTSVDQWALDHVMPWLAASDHPVTLVSAIRPVQPWDPSPQLPVDAWLYPASVPVSFLVVAAACAVLWRRGRRLPALAWAAAWVAADALELLFKHVLVRPALYDGAVHVVGFDGSFPSGHTLRTVIVAVLVGLVWPRLRVAAAAWAAVVLPMLVVASWHTPSDVLGGALLAGALVVPAARLTRRRALA